MNSCTTQNDLLLGKLMAYYGNKKYLDSMLSIINGSSHISLRLVDWFVTNYAKKNFTVITSMKTGSRFKIHIQYKLQLKAYSKKRFDPFCRWDRVNIPYYNNQYIETTIGQLNFFKWFIENNIIDYIEENFKQIEEDMNSRNSTSRQNRDKHSKTRKKREELSVSAIKSIKKEEVEIIVSFN
jgi:hypothetical protein